MVTNTFLRSRKLRLQLFSCLAISLFASIGTAHAADTKISTGLSHSCLVTEEKTVECWGNNSFGKLGRTDSNKFKAPVPGLTNVKSVAVGDNHSCALIEGGTVKCWGANTEGQLAQPAAITSSATPITVTEWATELVAGAAHNCAKTGSVVQCWGRNSSGQLGTGGFTPFYRSLVVVMASERGPHFSLQSLAAGTNHTCATLNGQIYCWGAGGSGQLGNQSTSNSAYPVQSNYMYGEIISAGTTHTCSTRIIILSA
jgi:alpha-tubulin suppressor-like RCC1 family protein